MLKGRNSSTDQQLGTQLDLSSCYQGYEEKEEQTEVKMWVNLNDIPIKMSYTWPLHTLHCKYFWSCVMEFSEEIPRTCKELLDSQNWSLETFT